MHVTWDWRQLLPWISSASFYLSLTISFAGEKPYKCEVCSKAFAESSTRRKHLLTHYPERKLKLETFSCEICGKLFKGDNSFKRHMLTHTRQKMAENIEPQQCTICHRMVRSNFKQHIKNHEVEKTFKCELCDAMFRTAFGVKMHMLTHTGRKDYCCGVCQKQFGTSSNLASHMRIHTGEKRLVLGRLMKVRERANRDSYFVHFADLFVMFAIRHSLCVQHWRSIWSRMASKITICWKRRTNVQFVRRFSLQNIYCDLISLFT